jgi:hypothetical protein
MPLMPEPARLERHDVGVARGHLHGGVHRIETDEHRA